MADIVIRQNDRRPYLLATLSDADGAVDLSGETVRFVAKTSDGTVKIDQTSASTDVVVVQASGTSGQVQYRWQDGDTDTAGTLLADFELTNVSTERETFPNEGHIEILITPELSTN